MFDYVETANSFWAEIAVAAGVPVVTASFGPSAVAVVDNGAGDFSLTIGANFSIPNNRFIPTIVTRSAIFALYVFDEANSTATSKRFRCFDAAAAALDNVNFSVLMQRLVILGG